RRARDRLDADRDALSGSERPHAVAGTALSALQGRVRRRLRRRYAVRADAPPVLERTPRADAAPRSIRRLHEVKTGCMVCHRQSGRDLSERGALTPHEFGGVMEV